MSMLLRASMRTRCVVQQSQRHNTFTRGYAVDIAKIKELRKMTRAGMNECHKALQDTNGDVTAAETLVLERMRAKGAKRAGREANERCVCGDRVQLDGKYRAVMLELTSETDFAAKSESILALVRRINKYALTLSPEECTTTKLLEQADPTTSGTFGETIQELMGKLKENIQLNSVASYEAPLATVYINTKLDSEKPEVGTSGSIISVDTPNPEKFDKFSRQMALQALSMRATCVTKDQLPADGEADDVLMDQEFWNEDKVSVAEVIARHEKENGSTFKVNNFQLFTKPEEV